MKEKPPKAPKEPKEPKGTNGTILLGRNGREALVKLHDTLVEQYQHGGDITLLVNIGTVELLLMETRGPKQ